jgi:hypothetical protein
MDYFVVGLLIVMVLVFFLFLKIVSSLTKALLYFFLVLLIVGLFFGFFFGKDAISFFKSMESEDKLFILKQNETFITGFEMARINETRSLSNDELNDYEELYAANKYDDILEDRYKVVYFEISGLEESNSTISSALVGDGGIVHIRNEDAKNAAFILLVTKKEKEDPFFLISGFQEGYIEVYPENFIFKVLRTRRK